MSDFRDRLAEALHDSETPGAPLGSQACNEWHVECPEPDREVANYLIASGVVTDPAEVVAQLDTANRDLRQALDLVADLRARVADGRPLDFLVTDDVLAEIRKRRMYEGAEAAATGRAPGRR